MNNAQVVKGIGHSSPVKIKFLIVVLETYNEGIIISQKAVIIANLTSTGQS